MGRHVMKKLCLKCDKHMYFISCKDYSQNNTEVKIVEIDKSVLVDPRLIIKEFRQ